MQLQWDVLVIGGGPAGISAASAAAEKGLEVLLLDEQDMLGGQIYRNVGGKNSDKHFLEKADRTDGLQLIDRFNNSGAHYAPNSTVWFVEPGRVLANTKGRSYEIKTQTLIIATGAMERPVPFPGWTLPGVMGAGAADLLYKNAGVIPKGPIVLAGNGPLIPLVGSHFAELGVEIAGILDTSPFANKITSMLHMPPALRDVPFLLKGVKMLKKLIMSGVPMHYGVSGIRALGEDRISGVAFKKGDKELTLDAGTLLFHEGVIPRTHITRTLKLEHAWDRTQRYWYPKVDKYGRSSVDGIYVVGDGAAVHGVYASIAKGELAGIDAVRRLQVLSKVEADDASAPVLKKLSKAMAPRGFVDAYFAPDPNVFKVPDETLVCRCEGVTAGDIRQAVREGCHEVNEIKIRTRCGMGPCQGRMCGTALAEIAAAELGAEVPAVGSLNIRPPLRPIPLSHICSLRDHGEALNESL